METFPLLVLQLVAVVLLFGAEWAGGVQGGALDARERVIDLSSMQAQAKDGVIHLDDNSVEKFTRPGPEPRPYAFFIFFDASHMRGSKKLKLVAHRAEFGLVATAFMKNNPNIQRVFFADLDFVESEWSFETFGVKTLPHIKYLPPGNGSLETSESMDWNAEKLVQFVEAKTRQKVGQTQPPPEFTEKQIIVLIGGLLLASPVVIRGIMTKDTLLHDAKFWACCALLVYFFIMSGGMIAIIRGTPFAVRNPDNQQLMFFVHGRSRQVGAEGIVVGSLYTLAGLLLAFATQFLCKIRSKAAQQILLLVVMGIFSMAVLKVINLNQWKTGYSIHGYWPTGLSPKRS